VSKIRVRPHVAYFPGIMVRLVGGGEAGLGGAPECLECLVRVVASVVEETSSKLELIAVSTVICRKSVNSILQIKEAKRSWTCHLES
jgi:hypothetical protein